MLLVLGYQYLVLSAVSIQQEVAMGEDASEPVLETRRCTPPPPSTVATLCTPSVPRLAPPSAAHVRETTATVRPGARR